MTITFHKRFPYVFGERQKIPVYDVWLYGTPIGHMWMKHSAVTGKPDSTAAWGFQPKPDLIYKFDEIELVRMLGEHLDQEKGKKAGK